MKINLFSTFLFSFLLIPPISTTLYSQCEPELANPLDNDPCGLMTESCIAMPDPDLDETCWGVKDITPYLARTVDMKGLWRALQENIDGTDPDCLPGGSGGDDCIYCKNIDALVKLKATFVLKTNQYWGIDVAFMKPMYSSYWDYQQQLARDINQAFDCAGLRRPIIQGGIWETLTPAVCQVPIPECVINHFKTNYPDEFTGLNAGNDAYYQPGISFNYKNMCFKEGWFDDCGGECTANTWEYPTGEACRNACHPDISKLETKMWYYYMAINLIDRGVQEYMDWPTTCNFVRK